jgi:hypothetical protein
MDPIERSRRLRQEADFILEAIDLYRILAPYRPMVFTGSYYLDVMVYPDIDLYIPKVSIEQCFQIAAGLATSELIAEIVFQRSRVPNLPGGLYLKPKIVYGAWERPWKVDIWSLEQAIIDEKMRDMLHFKAAMTEPLREQIIRYKITLLTAGGRTPMYSGYHIYKAMIDEGLSDPEAITRYLLAAGIQVETASERR